MPSPRLVERVTQMQAECRLARARADTIAIVPTLGALHDGHVSLIHEASRRADLVVVSVFVNPTQFGPKEDFSSYPRDLDGDIEKASGADVIFAPTVEDIYPSGFQTFVETTELSTDLEGSDRPSHFKGVTTVVAKLLNIVRPHFAVFGEKDYQQLLVVRRMAADLNLDTEILGVPTVRDSDGLAISSRNVYLSPAERAQATSLSRALFHARDLHRAGERDSGALVAALREVIDQEPLARIDYAQVRDAENLSEVTGITGPVVCLLAVRIGRTRLIDNMVLR